MNIINLINLLRVSKIGRQKIRLIYSQLGTDINPFELSIAELCSVKGIDTQSANQILKFSDFEIGIKEYEKAVQNGYQLISFWDETYPTLLKKIYNPPVLLYARGQDLIKEEDCVSIVGTRRFTPYGKTVSQQLTRELVQAGITIVSGLARGVDTIAHKETVKQGGRTIAVLGSGIDTIYPAENKKLADAICERGTIISEFPLGAKPDRKHFPMRNRIISGLCHGTVVVEAGNRSGAILTALNAVDQNRDIFAIPGRITDKQSIGTNRLIRNGALPISSADEILREINPKLFQPIQTVQKTIQIELSNDEKLIIDQLGADPIHIDEIASSVDMSVGDLLPILLKLELKNAIHQIGGKQFVRA